MYPPVVSEEGGPVQNEDCNLFGQARADGDVFITEGRVDPLGRPLWVGRQQRLDQGPGLFYAHSAVANLACIKAEDTLSRRVVQIDREGIVEIELEAAESNMVA